MRNVRDGEKKERTSSGHGTWPKKKTNKSVRVRVLRVRVWVWVRTPFYF